MPLLNTFFISSNTQTMIQFYSDLISSSTFHNQISYLQKYDQNELQDYSMVVCGEYMIRGIIQNVIKTDVTKLTEINQVVANQVHKLVQEHITNQQNKKPLQQEQFNTLTVSISQAIYNRLQEIKSQYILQAVALGSLQLIDVNWKITKTLSSQARSFIGQKLPYLFKLTLYLKQIHLNNSSIKPISLQLSKVQLKQFIGQLKSLKSQM